MLFWCFERVINPLLMAVPRDTIRIGELSLVQLEHGAEIDISFSGACFHLKVKSPEVTTTTGESISELNCLAGFEEFVIEQRQAVADPARSALAHPPARTRLSGEFA